MPDRATFIADHWRAYIKVNQEFADKAVYALRLLKEDKEKNGTAPPIVWVHDYHLMLAANWIRQVHSSGIVSLDHKIHPSLGPATVHTSAVNYITVNVEDKLLYFDCSGPEMH